MYELNFCSYIISTGAYSIQLVRSDEISKKVLAAAYLLALFVLASLVYRIGENISREVRSKALEKLSLKYSPSSCSLECSIG
jgi:hypothetical protein